MPVKDGFLAGRNLSPTEVLTRNFTMDELNKALPARELFATFYYKSITNTTATGYASWWKDVDLYHGLLHNSIKGQLITPRSPVDPLFYLHHSYYDKIFDNAQQGWKSKGLPIMSFYDPNNNCLPSTKFHGYDNILADVLGNLIIFIII